MLFSKCNSSQPSRGERTFLKERDFLTIKLIIQWTSKTKLILLKTALNRFRAETQVGLGLLLKRM